MTTLEQLAGELIAVPLMKLVDSPLNVRRTGGGDVDELAALIEANGLLQNLVVTEQRGRRGQVLAGRFEVVAGGRRRRALVQLAEAGRIARDFAVPCRCVAREAALVASAAENSAREPMHPADEFEAFAAMVEAGYGTEDIAARFGVAPLVVQRRLRLASVAPALVEQYRQGRMALDQLMALAITDDQERQLAVWSQASAWERTPHALRRILTQGEVEVSRPVVRYVGLKAYEKAGGAVRRDLFDDDDAGHIIDVALLQTLARDKLAKQVPKLRAEGWSWVEVRPEFGASELSGYGRAPRGMRAPEPEEQASLDALLQEQQQLQGQLQALYEGDEDDDSVTQQIDAAERREGEVQRLIAGLRESLACWPAAVQAAAGVVLTIDERGGAKRHEGLIRPEDRKAAAKALERVTAEAAARVTDEEREASDEPRGAHSGALVLSLSAQRTLALQVLLADNQRVAMAVLAHRMLQALIQDPYPRAPSTLCVGAENVFDRVARLTEGIEGSRAWQQLQARLDRWRVRIPGEVDAVLPWLLELDPAQVGELIAVCTALTVDALQQKQATHPAGDQLAQALGLDMADWWQATTSGYLSRVPKAMVVRAVTEAVSIEAAAPLAKLSKGDAVVRAEALLSGTRWLPQPLRTSS